jgi:hypothetical protein
MITFSHTTASDRPKNQKSKKKKKKNKPQNAAGGHAE